MTFMNNKPFSICRAIRNGVSGCRKAAFLLQNDLRGNTMRILKLLKLFKGLDISITTEKNNGRDALVLVIAAKGQTIIIRNADLLDIKVIEHNS